MVRAAQAALPVVREVLAARPEVPEAVAVAVAAAVAAEEVVVQLLLPGVPLRLHQLGR